MIETEKGPSNARPLRAREMVVRARSSTGYEDIEGQVLRTRIGEGGIPHHYHPFGAERLLRIAQFDQDVGIGEVGTSINLTN